MLKNYILLFTGWLLCQQARAQLCQGSLGDPIVNITFGSGSNPGPPLSAAATGYQYLGSDCPNDGFYTLRSRTDNCFTGWHTLTSDHTGNVNGYFMLVNASYQPSAFYIDTVDLQCSNTTYEFAAWVVTMNRPYECSGNPIQPNLSFNIERTDGTVLQTYNTGDISTQSTPLWKQYGFFFNTPPGVSKVVLRITNNAPGGCGNDLALDDITFRPCGPLLNASIAGNGVLKEFCEGEAQPQTLSCVVSPGYANPYFQWQESIDGAAWTDIAGANELMLDRNFSSTTPAAEYRYRLAVSQLENLSVAACRVASNVVTVKINGNPPKIAQANLTLCEESEIRVEASGATQYQWTGPNGFTASDPVLYLQNAPVSQSGDYFLDLVTAAGCEGKDTVHVVVNPRPAASVPTDTVFICEGSSTSLTATGGDTYLWEPSLGLSSATSSAPVASPLDSTQYMVIVTNAFSCSDTAYIQVNVSKKPVADAGPDKYIMQGQTAQLTGKAGGTHVSYSWTPTSSIDNIASLEPLVHPGSDQVYRLEVLSLDGCGAAADSVNVHVFKAVYVPNAFSPNKDGLNDYWNIPALKAHSNYEIRVYNRWGHIVYASKTINEPWDGTYKGKALPTGVYPYIIDLKEIPARLTGWVVLVR